MSIVVFDPDSTEDVDFADRMRHPARRTRPVACGFPTQSLCSLTWMP